MQQNPYLQNVHTKSNNQINCLGGGINTVYPPQFLQDDECQDMYNLSLDKYPAIKTCNGIRAKGIFYPDGIQYAGAIEFDVTYGNHLTRLEKQDIFFITNHNELVHYSGKILDKLQNDTASIRYGHFCYKDGNDSYLVIYGSGIIPKRYKLPLGTEFSKIEELNTPNNIDFSCMCYHKNRFVGADEDMLYFSAIQDPNDWTTPEITAEVKVENCNKITGLASFDDKLIVFSEHNMHIFYGSSVNQSLSNAFTCVNLDNNIGCYNHRCIISHNSFLYWVGENNNIFEYDGSAIRNITEPTSNNGISGGIKNFIKNFSCDKGDISLGASDNKIYFNFIRIVEHSIQIFPLDIECFLLIFDQRLRKWTRLKAPRSDMYKMIFSPKIDYDNERPVYAITKSGYIYNIADNRDDGFNTLLDTSGDKWETYSDRINFYLKTKEYKNGTLSKKKSLSQLWFNYDLIDGVVDINIITNDNRNKYIGNALPRNVMNATHCILIPNELQDADSYTFEISGIGYLCIYAIERIDRTDTR